jgi:hypothetical protein
MGLDLKMIGDHSLVRDPQIVRELVLECLAFSYHDEVLSTYCRRMLIPEAFWPWKENSWHPDQRRSMEEVNTAWFSGPWGLGLEVGEKSLCLRTHFRWFSFLSEDVLAERVRLMVGQVIGRLGGTVVISVPDHATATSSYAALVDEKEGIDSILERMKTEVGPPCSDAAELIAANRATGYLEGYLVERIVVREN